MAERRAAGRGQGRRFSPPPGDGPPGGRGEPRQDVVDTELERWLGERLDEHLQRARLELTGSLAERLSGALAELHARGELLLAEEVDRLREVALEVIESVRGAQTKAEESAERVATRVEAATATLSAKARRHELKLAREESSRRARLAARGLERRADELRAELERIEGQGTARAAGAVERALRQAGEVERRMQAMEGRIAALEDRVLEVAAAAGRAGAVEARMLAAAQIEDDAARRISEAERRIARLVRGEGPERPADREPDPPG